MAGITLAQAETQLASWLAADTAVASGQSYTIGGRSLTRAQSAEIRNNITYWNNMVQKLSAEASRGSSGLRVRGVTPV